MTTFKGRLAGDVKLHGPSLALLTALTVVMCRNLIFSAEFPGGWDVASITYPIGYFSKTHSYLSLWEDSGTGYVTPISLFHLLGLVADVLGDPALISRAVLVFAVLSAALLMYLYTFTATRRALASMAAGIIFSTSPWFAANVADGHGFLILAYALAPLFFLLVDRGLERVTWVRVLGLGLLLSLLPSLRLDPIAYIFPFIVLFAVWHVVTAGRRWRTALANALRLLLPALALGVLLSAYVWLPMLRTGTAHATVRFGLATIANDTLSFWPSLQGHGLIYSYIFWRGGTSHYTHQFLPPFLYGAVLFLTPALAFAQVWLRENRRVSFFISAALISVFLAKGPWPPLGEVYELLWRHVPLFDRLHVANRWLMVGWCAYAFLAGLTVDRIHRVTRRELAVVGRGRLPKAGAAGVVILLLVGCTMGMSYLFTDGYQTWQIPSEEVAPHQWLGENSGEGRFLGVPFEGRRTFVPGGWIQHDLSYLGGMFSGRPSFDEPSFEGYGGDFASYVEELIQQRSDFLARITGAYDVRYVVAQGYSSNTLPGHPIVHGGTSPITVVLEYWEHNYFDELEGLKKVFEGVDPQYTMRVGVRQERELTYNHNRPRLWDLEAQARTAIYENEYWVPRAFVPERRMLVVGGLDSLATISEWNEVDLQAWDVRFASRTLNELGREGLIEALRRTDLLLLHNAELLDLAMMMADTVRADFGAVVVDPEAEWSLVAFPEHFTEERGVLRTGENHAEVTLPINLDSASPGRQYELWARVFHRPYVPVFCFEVDGQEIGSVLPSAPEAVGFVWEKVGTASLQPGPHEVSVTALGVGGAFDARLDEIALVRPEAIGEAVEVLVSMVGESGAEVVSLQDPSRLWRQPTPSTKLSRFKQLDITLEDSKQAGVHRALYGGRDEVPRFLPGGRFLIREARPAGGYTPLLQLEFEEPQDWHEATYLRVDFKGVGGGEKVRVRIAFAGYGTAFYSFEDLSSQWETIIIPLFDPEGTAGTIRWDQVSMLIFDTSGVDMGGGVGLGTIRLLQDSSSLEHLSNALGMRTFMLSPRDPTPASVAQFLSASGDQPAEILESEQVRPWLHHLRIAARESYTLVFSNTYDPLWRVVVDGREISPQPSYYFVNAYAIEKVGEYDLTLEFVGQRYQWYAFSLSGLAFGGTCVALAGCLLRRWRRKQCTRCWTGAQDPMDRPNDDC